MTDTDQWNETPDSAIQEDEWKEIEDEVQIKFEVIGDGFIGRLISMDPPNANGIIQAHLVNVADLAGNHLADRAFLNLTKNQYNKYRVIPMKAMVRDEWTGNLDTGHSSGVPMQVHNVKWK